VPDEAVVTGPRIGVRGDEVAVTIPWRFHIQDTRCVSRYTERRSDSRGTARSRQFRR
jgi:3-methyladenine DNA glycosylase Mpg